MQNLLNPLAQATVLWNNLFGNNAFGNNVSEAVTSLRGLSSYGVLNISGFADPEFSYSTGGKALCVSGTIKVPVVALIVEVLYKGPANNYELTEFITNFLRRDSDSFASSIGGTKTVSDTFDIYSKLCVPADSTTSKDLTSIQFLSHGGTLDHTYWDFAPSYSYVDAAAVKGYATFSYDRLGIARSAQPDPLQIVQMPLQAELAHVLIQKLKSGSIGGLAFQKVVGIGHSLGAALTQSVSSLYPTDFSALSLTGHSNFHAGSGTGFSANAQQIANTLRHRPDFKHLPNGYYTLGPVPQALQFAFFAYPHFDPIIFKSLLNTLHTNALGETLTLFPTYAPTTFSAPVQILNGNRDFFYCQGNCLAAGGDVSAESLAYFFPDRDVAKSEAVTLADVGHNINMHYGRSEAFERMLGFVQGAGIKT